MKQLIWNCKINGGNLILYSINHTLNKQFIPWKAYQHTQVLKYSRFSTKPKRWRMKMIQIVLQSTQKSVKTRNKSIFLFRWNKLHHEQALEILFRKNMKAAYMQHKKQNVGKVFCYSKKPPTKKYLMINDSPCIHVLLSVCYAFIKLCNYIGST